MRAALLRAARAEAATSTGHMSCTLLLDVERFFDSIKITEVARLAAGLGFPSTALALACQLHSCPRIFRSQGHYSEPLGGFGCSILAGCTSSTSIALCILYDILEYVLSKRPLACPSLHVDDLGFSAVEDPALAGDHEPWLSASRRQEYFISYTVEAVATAVELLAGRGLNISPNSVFLAPRVPWSRRLSALFMTGMCRSLGLLEARTAALMPFVMPSGG